MSSTPPVINPTKFTINDPAATSETVTSFNVDLGRTSGQYTLKAPITLDKVTSDGAGNYTGLIADLHEQLGSGQWFAAATAVNANGESSTSPEGTFTIVPPPPTAPTSLTFSAA